MKNFSRDKYAATIIQFQLYIVKKKKTVKNTKLPYFLNRKQTHQWGKKKLRFLKAI